MTGFAGFFFCVVGFMYRSLSQPKTGHFGSVFGCFSEGHWRDVRPLQRWVHTHDRIGGCHFRGKIQMRIDVGRRRNIAVTQPLLNFFQADPISIVLRFRHRLWRSRPKSECQTPVLWVLLRRAVRAPAVVLPLVLSVVRVQVVSAGQFPWDC